MEVTIIRLSRPLIINTETIRDNYFQTVYGFLIPEKYKPTDKRYIDDYVRYLCGMHCYSNGDNFFTISYDARGVPRIPAAGRLHDGGRPQPCRKRPSNPAFTARAALFLSLRRGKDARQSGSSDSRGHGYPPARRTDQPPGSARHGVAGGLPAAFQGDSPHHQP